MTTQPADNVAAPAEILLSVAAGPSGAGSPDPQLVKLIRLWDNLDEEGGQPNTLGVTIVVQGATYSGLLIAGRVWARAMAHLLHTAPENPQLRVLGDLFDQIGSTFEQVDAKADPYEYLHLANVAVGLPGSGSQSTLLVRFRMADVSGWTVGTAGSIPHSTALAALV